ncbi:sensor domain-containing diguanylate cyclase [Marinobacter confluentis]|uniref:Sensor domain-containing diguanylate cyclase n=1 Tax=Marinobacter confluentis TaxID=1697557 RepID=A0A4Z1BSG5_9GAMM|nr:sensor domain-containing diguanylate cyclase [Marinobacter confluentis]TGN40655.1 sensor domain-containing diguanylate cyclase [Marinobacter confluentis]
MTIDVQALFPKLVNLLLDTVFLVDESNHIVFVSDACHSLLGYQPEEMIGRPILDFIHPDDLEATRASAQRIMNGLPHNDFENRYLHKEGRVVHILWSARLYEEERLRIGVARDVTALRRADQTRNALYRISEAAHAADNFDSLCIGVKKVIAELFPKDRLNLEFHDAETSALPAPESGQQRSDRVVDILLVSKNATLGRLTLEKTVPQAAFDDKDRELLEFVATQVAAMVERKKAEETLRFMAHHDPLTGLTNRALFYDRLETALRTASRNNSRLALLYLDLNEFKRINDTWGHEAGDEVLRAVAQRLEAGTRQSDTIGRMGGDEFTVLLNDIPDAAAVVEAAAEKIRDILAKPIDFAGQSFSITSSIGVALYPEDGDTARQLLIRADTNMYLNKHGA